MADEILTEERGKVLLITLNRPEQRNSVNRALAEAMAAALDHLDNSPGLSVGVLTGNGKGFCAGGDVAGMERRMSAPTGEIAFNGWHRQQRVHYTQSLLHTLPKPVIAAVNGAAVGAGMNLALGCDVRIAAERAKFDTRFLQIGIHPGGGHTWMFRRIAGPQATMAAVIFGEVLDGFGAFDLGDDERLAACLLHQVAGQMDIRCFAREGDGEKIGIDFSRRDHVGFVLVGQRRGTSRVEPRAGRHQKAPRPIHRQGARARP